MKNIYLSTVLVLLLIINLSAEVRPIEGLINPNSITVTEKEMIITQGHSFLIFNLKDMSLKKKFGKEGEGPREFKINSYMEKGLIIDLQPDTILVSSVGKLTFFNRNGEYLKEQKASHNFFGNRFLGFGKNFIGTGTSNSGKTTFITLNIYDKNLNIIKEILKWKQPYQRGAGTEALSYGLISPRIYKNKLFTKDKSKLSIYAYDKNGDKVQTIQYKYNKLKVPEKFKKKVINFYKTDPATKDVFKHIIPLIFPEYYPAVKDFFVDNNKIFIITYKSQENKSEFIVLDMKGKLIKRIFLPLHSKDLLSYYPYTIYNGTLYQLKDNEETEEWDIHIHKIL